MTAVPRALLLALFAIVGCHLGGAPAALAPTKHAAPIEVTLLFTSDEHGWLLPRAEKGKIHGGAAAVLGLWVATEGHCPGPPSPPCPEPRTLALSAGDNYTGPAISTYFAGAPMAEAMARMGYAASAFGNHELDFGRERFLENRARSGMIYLAANLRAPPERKDMELSPYAIFDRRGLKIGVVGLSTESTLRAAMARRFEGITFDAAEPALDRAVRGAWSAGADAVVVMAHECPDVLAPMVERHPEWRLSFVGAGHCHRLDARRVGGVPLISPGFRLDHYVRVKLTADLTKPAGERVIAVAPEVITMSRPEGARSSAPPDPVIAARAEAWRARVDAALGEQIGWSARGFDRDGPEMGRWIAGALRAETGADVGIVNESGLRQNLPSGPITLAHVWSILPFDNRVMTVRLDGASLFDNLRRRGAVIAGAARADGGFVLDDGRKVTGPGPFTATTLDFLFYGGDHFTFDQHAQAVVEGPDWRDVVITWTRRQRSTQASPLEAHLPR